LGDGSSSYAGQHDRRAVGEFSDKRQIAAHGLDGLAERGQQEVAALFEARNAVLGNPEGLMACWLITPNQNGECRGSSCS